MEKIILFIIVIIKPNKDNSPILENFASHKKSITSFFSLHLSPNPLPFIMVAFVKFPVIIIFLYKKISEICIYLLAFYNKCCNPFGYSTPSLSPDIWHD